MGYPQKLLGDGEFIEFELKPHWRALIVPGIVLIAVVFGLVFFLTRFDGDGILSALGTWGAWIIGAFLLIVFAIRPFLYWITTQYVFTNRRIIIRSGLVSRQGRDMPLSKVNNASFDVTFFGRLLNYGRLTVDSASDEALIIDDVPNVEGIQREVNRLHEEDDLRRRKFMRGDDMNEPPPPPSS
ncbi:MAG: PH domain-containing protein [Actinomycetia bacterium]|nr:PH domain-containing protein [Actinomycetes bacterium]